MTTTLAMVALALALALSSAASVSGGGPDPRYARCFIETLAWRSRAQNLDAVVAAVDFSDYAQRSPYPDYHAEGGYDTAIERSQDCYVNVTSALGAAPLAYSLHSWTPAQAAARNASGRVFLTHANPCGACSSLDQLAVYLNETDLTAPVRRCGIESFVDKLKPGAGTALNLACLAKLGFSNACQYIWFYNTIASRDLCGAVCLAEIRTPNNVQQRRFWQTNYCEPHDARHNRGGCLNSINGKNACDAFQWRDGDYRLNSCLQCDECRSGPVFQRVSGRFRRDSGILSAIRRPPAQVVNISHFYGFHCEDDDADALGAVAGDDDPLALEVQ